MAIEISSDIVIGNAIITMKKTCISKSLIHQYWHNVDNLLPKNYYTYGNNNSFSDFCEGYPFLIRVNGDKILIDKDVLESGILNRYFRMGVSKKILQVFDEVALNMIKTKENDVYTKKLKKVEKN